MIRRSLLALLLAVFAAGSAFAEGPAAQPSSARTGINVGSDKKVKAYLLESVQLTGTDRMTYSAELAF